MDENVLSNKLENWFKNKGYKTEYRRRINNNIEIDVLAKKGNIIKGIEIKAGTTKAQINKALIQTLKFKPYLDYSYIATPIKPTVDFINMCKSSGIGIFIIENTIKEILPAIKNKNKLNLPICNFRTNNIGQYIQNEWILVPLLIIISKLEDKTISTGYIAGKLSISQQTASRHINLAKEKGYLEKTPHGHLYSYILTDRARIWLKNIVKQLKEKIN